MTTLDRLRPGSLFVDEDGAVGFKSKQGVFCYGSGEVYHGKTGVRLVDLTATEILDLEMAAMVSVTLNGLAVYCAMVVGFVVGVLVA